MKREDLQPGVTIQGSFSSEPVKVEKTETLGNDYIQIIGYKIHSKKYEEFIFNIKEIESFQIYLDKPNFSSEPFQFFQALETLRYRYASLYDPLLAVSIAKVDPLPHQIEAVYRYILKQPRIRFLIADDPGAGKTIMAGLTIKELKLRHVLKRILIVAPGHLKDQWMRELKEKFNESFTILDRSSFNQNYGTNVWEKENQIITSLDFAKQEDVLPNLGSAEFDLVIVDEAHKMSAYQYGDNIKKSRRYKLGETLSRISNHFLLLTATPHKGDPENFRLFLDLLEPGFFATTAQIQESIRNKDNPLFLRRIKEELKDFEGKPLFLPRYVTTVRFHLSDEERELYNELSIYVEEEYNKSLQLDKKRNIAFALAILQRRFASSIYALLHSLERRKKKLEELLDQSNAKLNPSYQFTDDLEEEWDDLTDEEREKEEQKWETLTIATNKEELKYEIKILENLIHKSKAIIQKEIETKLSKLKESLNELQKHLPDEQKRKILIFTESKDTLHYLKSKMENWNYKVVTIHGGMNLYERIQAESIFKNESEILIATEAAGEGINLQFCNLMINYDIPWNPNRLEQRLGRIHRYGQTKEVFIHNLVNIDTREGKVLEKLFDKIEEIKNALGTDKVFDVLGEIIDSKKFTEAILNAAVNAKDINAILNDLEFKVDEHYIKQVKENLGETLATHYLDYTFIQEMAMKAKENKLIPEYTQSYFLRAFEKLGGKVEKKPDSSFEIKSIPSELKTIAKEDTFKKTYGEILSHYPAVTFRKEALRSNSSFEFLTFGHPLFEALMQYVETHSRQTLLQGAKFYDPDGKMDGFVLFYEGSIQDGTGKIAGKRIFSYFYSKEGVKSISPYILWDLKEFDNSLPSPELEEFDIETIQKTLLVNALQDLETYKKEIQEERNRQADIKRKYGLESLNHFIITLDKEIVELTIEQDKGKKSDSQIARKKERKQEYETAKERLQKLIEQEKSLFMNSPNFIGAVRVIPYRTTSIMTSDEEIEKAGMEYAMDYEKAQGRTPEDVSSQNLGYDIRSVDSQGKIRYIEVKARSTEGDVVLTQNEWFKAERFGEEYYLYVIYHANTNPKLHIIQNPTRTLTAEPKIELVRYFIKQENITRTQHD